MSKEPVDFFTKNIAEHYDERNSKLATISDNLHFLIKLILENLPEKSKILSAGAGTGAEILYLAKAFPEWTFVAAEPSLSMLTVCREKIQKAGLSNRCRFVHGYAHDLPLREEFDATLAILVAHFVKHNDRVDFYKSLTNRLRVGGYLVTAEISYDLDSSKFPSMLRNWKAVSMRMGATSESLEALPKQLKDVLTVLPPLETEALIKKSGINIPIHFFQALMISAWYGAKSST